MIRPDSCVTGSTFAAAAAGWRRLHFSVDTGQVNVYQGPHAGFLTAVSTQTAVSKYSMRSSSTGTE